MLEGLADYGGPDGLGRTALLEPLRWVRDDLARQADEPSPALAADGIAAVALVT